VTCAETGIAAASVKIAAAAAAATT